MKALIIILLLLLNCLFTSEKKYVGGTSKHSSETLSDINNDWTIYRVKTLNNYLGERLGPPDLTSTNINDFIGKKGIILFRVIGWSNATGHITLWDGTNTVYSTRNYINLPTKLKLESVKFWSLL